MEWWNARLPEWRTPPLSRADSLTFGTWARLTSFCLGVENGGTIASCRNWTDEDWRVMTLVSKAEVDHSSEIWSWSGDDLVVRAYPAQMQKQAEASRERRRKGGSAKTSAKGAAARHNGKRGGRPRHFNAHYNAERATQNQENPTKDKIREDKISKDKGKVSAPSLPDKFFAGAFEKEIAPVRFPQSAETAATAATNTGCPAEFAVFIWNKAASRGGCDAKGVPIRCWQPYLAMEWTFEQRRQAKAPESPVPGPAKSQTIPAWQQIKSLESMITDVDRQLRTIPRPNPDVMPEEFRAVEARRAPLLEKKVHLQGRIDQLNAACAGVGNQD